MLDLFLFIYQFACRLFILNVVFTYFRKMCVRRSPAFQMDEMKCFIYLFIFIFIFYCWVYYIIYIVAYEWEQYSRMHTIHFCDSIIRLLYP